MSVEIELFYSPWCLRCAAARRRLRALVAGSADGKLDYRERNVLENLERAVELGVTATPALAIGGRLVAVGRWQEARLRTLLAATRAGV
jgi:predicted DsbA family dithiol-disulfide isomerase